MTWLTIILYSKKIWVWCKHHWKILALALWTLVIYFIARRNLGAHKKVLNTTIENYKKEVEILENSHKEEIQQRNDAINKHNNEIEKLERNYSGGRERLGVEKRSRYMELVKMYDTDPENISKMIQDEFGFKYEE
tara:strand:- start:277 stop:681 length:405 start_codon:yes stop_codon:yes gene_type:complete